MSKQSIFVPDIGADQADVIEILVKPGDVISPEQPIVVLESDKASMEVPCPHGGKVADIAVTVGQKVKQGDLLLALETVSPMASATAAVSGVESGTAAVPATARAAGTSSVPATAAMTSDSDHTASRLPVAAIGKELNVVSDLLESGVSQAAPTSELSFLKAPASGRTQLVRAPDIGAESADVIEILVREGDSLKREQSLLVLESAKASMEVPSPVAGVVSRVLVKVGDKVAENTPLLEVTVASSDDVANVGVGAGGGAASGGAVMNASESTVISSGANVVGADVLGHGVASSSPASLSAASPIENVVGERASQRAALMAPPPAAAGASSAVHAGPAVRRLARELGVDLARVKASGPRDRILKQDVHAFVKEGMQRLTAGYPAPAVAPSPSVIDFSRWGPVERVPLTRIQRVSAENLHRAWSTIPHVTQFDEADITELEAFRVGNKDAVKAEGLSLTLLSFLVKTVAHCLKEFPRFASSLDGDGETLVMKGYVHIGVAVDTPNGLVVPVIRDADRKSIREIARDLGELSVKAREKKLSPGDMQGACFTISSLGGIGGTAFTPIVNWPEVAILGVSRSAMRPVWDGSEFRPRLMLPLSLSYDHRVIDGAVAARFTTALAARLADIRRLLL
ncbi:MAG TPA: dihydrolipoyllysine-residue acetyltransferase [Moraxellaceae bacterium]|nr:dihydrolipoyllysine-residue acetyltransferase [Moraxellaceae bacterium]